MNALTPAGHVKAEAEVKKQVPQLHRSQASSAADAEFTLPGILHAAENTGYHYTERQPKGLTVGAAFLDFAATRVLPNC
jgi:hypothetical protein